MGETIANRIKKLRLEFDFTQEDLATRLGLKGKSSIANYEAGKITPSDEIKLKMCEIFNCSLDYLMGKSDVRNPEDKLKEEFLFAYHKETEGLSKEEIKEAIEFYKRIKYGDGKEKK